MSGKTARKGRAGWPEGILIPGGLFGATESWRWFDRFEQSLGAGVALGLIVIAIGLTVAALRARPAKPLPRFGWRFVVGVSAAVALAGVAVAVHAWTQYAALRAKHFDIAFAAGAMDALCIAGIGSLILPWWRARRAV